MLTASVPTRHARLIAWVEEFRALCQPDAVVWCDGSQEENERLCAEMVASGTAVRLNPEKRPNSLPVPLRPARRRARRGPHLHLLPPQGRRRPHQQLDGSRRR